MAVVLSHQWDFENNLTDSIGALVPTATSGITYNSGYLTGYALSAGLATYNGAPFNTIFGSTGKQWSMSFDLKQIGNGFGSGPGYTYYRDICSSGDGTTEGIYLRYQINGTTASFYVALRDNSTGYLFYSSAFPSIPGLNTWFHIDLSYDDNLSLDDRIIIKLNDSRLTTVRSGAGLTGGVKTISNFYIGPYEYSDSIYNITLDNYKIYTGLILNPIITDITPSTLIHPGDVLTITGTELIGLDTTLITIDGDDYTANILTQSSTEITLTAPNLTLGGVYPLIITADTFYSSDPYNITYYIAPTPIITSISDSIITYSGTEIIITGTDLKGASTTLLKINGVDYSQYITSFSSTEIKMITPNLVNGTYSITITADGSISPSYSITYTSGRSVSMSTYALDVLLTNSSGVASTGLTLTAVNILGGFSPYTLTEKGNGWYSNASVPQGEYVIFKDVSGTPTSTGVYISHVPGISEEVGGYRNVLDQKLKKEYKSVYNFGPQGVAFNSASIIACYNEAVSEGIKSILIPPGTYELESAISIASDDVTFIGNGNVTFKYPTGITTADWALLKIGGANFRSSGITFDLTGISNSNTTLGGIHLYQAGAVNPKIVDCVIKNRTGGPAINCEYGSMLKLDACKFTGNTYDIKARVANFNDLLISNCQFEAGQNIDEDGIRIYSNGNSNYGSNLGKYTADTQLIGVYYDGTTYRKTPGTTHAWLISSTAGTIIYTYKDISAQAAHSTVTFGSYDFAYDGLNGLFVADKFSAVHGITYNAGLQTYRTKQFTIGDWDMDATGTVTVDISSIKGTSAKYYSIIRDISVMIVNDSEANVYPLTLAGDYAVGEVSGLISLNRTGAGFFDNTSFDSTSFNRGYVTITYLYT